MSQPPHVSVVCLSYKRPHLLREALASLAVQTHPLHELIVVDNRSERSGEVAAVVEEFPAARLLANAKNLGFTGGMNSGLQAATGEYVVLTEDDITLAPGAIRAVVEHLSVHPRVGLVGGLMLNKQSGTIRCAGGRVRLGSRFELDVIGESAVDTGQFAEPFAVSYLPGAFLAARRSVWERLGGFRERYYLYMEDVDLCVRAAAAGYTLATVPAARVYHADPPADAEPPPWLRRLKYQNLLRLYLLNAPGRVLPAFLARYALWEPLRHLVEFSGDGMLVVGAVFQTAVELPSMLCERRSTSYRTCPRE